MTTRKQELEREVGELNRKIAELKNLEEIRNQDRFIQGLLVLHSYISSGTRQHHTVESTVQLSIDTLTLFEQIYKKQSF